MMWYSSAMFDAHEQQIQGASSIENADLVDLNETLKQLERFWASQTSGYGGF